MKKPPIFWPSFLAPFGALWAPLATLVWSVQDIQVDEIIREHTLKVAMINFPIYFFTLFLLIFITSWLFRLLNLISKKTIIYLTLIYSIFMGVLSGLQGYQEVGIRHGLDMFILSSLIYIPIVGMGSLVWWWVYQRILNNNGNLL